MEGGRRGGARFEMRTLIYQHRMECTTRRTDIWCSEVLDWPKLLASAGFQELRMLQTLANGKGLEILTTRCPFRIDGEVLSSATLAPKVGEQTAAISEEFGL